MLYSRPHRTDTPGPSRGHAGSDTLCPSPSYSTRKSVLQLLFIFPSWWHKQAAGLVAPEIRTLRAHHHGQEGHAVHLRLGDVDPGDVQDGRTEVDVGHQHLLHRDSLAIRHRSFTAEQITSIPDCSGSLWCSDLWPWEEPWCRTRRAAACPQEARTDLEGEIKRVSRASWTVQPNGSRRTCVVAVVRGEDDVRVVQFASDLQPLHKLLHQVVYWQQSAPPAGTDDQVTNTQSVVELSHWKMRLEVKQEAEQGRQEAATTDRFLKASSRNWTELLLIGVLACLISQCLSCGDK